MPPPSALKRKILIKNKRLKPEVEKVELELFLAGKFEAKDEVVEDASGAAPPPPAEPPKVIFFISKIKRYFTTNFSVTFFLMNFNDGNNVQR